PNDRRCVLVSLTDAGRRIVLARRYELNEYFSHVLDRLGERDAREGLRILQRIAAIVEEMENGETMAKGNAENDPK
ncbi:MAG: hypothetical protein IKL84_07010, partial [Clostridia bacterium]|nr:hypothetical protein [Clostridia bacterium]